MIAARPNQLYTDVTRERCKVRRLHDGPVRLSQSTRIILSLLNHLIPQYTLKTLRSNCLELRRKRWHGITNQFLLLLRSHFCWYYELFSLYYEQFVGSLQTILTNNFFVVGNTDDFLCITINSLVADKQSLTKKLVVGIVCKLSTNSTQYRQNGS